MRSVFRYGALAILTGAFLLAAAPAPTLEGRWKLVEQRYGSGNANLAAIEAPVRLEFFLANGRLAGRIWSGEDPTKALSWPAMPTEHGPHPVDIRQIAIDPATNLARAVYRPHPSSPEGELLEIVEEYRVVEGGSILQGSVTIRSLGPGKSSGSYVLQRRFERER
jgi:hypothetical protein